MSLERPDEAANEMLIAMELDPSLFDARYTYARLLGHRKTATTAKYAHLFDDPLHAEADATANQLAAWLKGNADFAISFKNLTLGPKKVPR